MIYLFSLFESLPPLSRLAWNPLQIGMLEFLPIYFMMKHTPVPDRLCRYDSFNWHVPTNTYIVNTPSTHTRTHMRAGGGGIVHANSEGYGEATITIIHFHGG